MFPIIDPPDQHVVFSSEGYAHMELSFGGSASTGAARELVSKAVTWWLGSVVIRGGEWT